jgi:hypothetical protein
VCGSQKRTLTGDSQLKHNGLEALPVFDCLLMRELESRRVGATRKIWGKGTGVIFLEGGTALSLGCVLLLGEQILKYIAGVEKNVEITSFMFLIVHL